MRGTQYSISTSQAFMLCSHGMCLQNVMRLQNFVHLRTITARSERIAAAPAECNCWHHEGRPPHQLPCLAFAQVAYSPAEGELSGHLACKQTKFPAGPPVDATYSSAQKRSVSRPARIAPVCPAVPPVLVSLCSCAFHHACRSPHYHLLWRDEVHSTLEARAS